MKHAFLKVCQTILLKNKEKGVLLLRLRHNKKWELPGGRLDKGEGWLEGLRREVEEL